MVGISDASKKMRNEIFSVGGHVIMIVNRKTEAAAVIDWSSKKIIGVVPNNLAAEIFSPQQMV